MDTAAPSHRRALSRRPDCCHAPLGGAAVTPPGDSRAGQRVLAGLLTTSSQRRNPSAAYRHRCFCRPSCYVLSLTPAADPLRCERGFTGNTIGQANAVSDKLLDLRGCKFDGKSLAGKTLSGALMVDASFAKADLTESVMSKVYAVHANFSGATFRNAVLDRTIFNGSDMRGASFENAVVTGSEFVDADLTGSDWSDALVGQEDLKRICLNPTLVGESRLQIGCRK